MQITGNTLTEDTHNIRNIAIDKPSSPLLTTLKIIWNAVKGIFKKIGNFFKNLFSKNENKTTLTNHEIEMIQNAQQLYNPTVKKEETKANSLSDRDVTHHSSQAGSDIPPKNTLEKKKDDSVSITIKDPDTSQKMIETVLECVFEEKIKPEITNVKEGLGKLSEVLKIAGDLAIRIGDKAAKPLFEKLKGFSIEEKVKPDLLSLLNWLLKDGVKNDFENLLKERLKNEHDNEELLDKFTQPCIKWLLETDHSTPLSQAYTNARIPIQGNKEAIDKAFETAMLVLLDNKIEQYMNKYHAKFDESLPGIVHKMLIDNGKRISSILTQRMINVVENSSFPEMFNNLLYVALDQSEAIIAAEKAKENEMTNQNALYEKAKNVERIQTNTESEATNKSMLLAHKNKIDEVGKEEYIKAEAEKKALQTYTNQDVCHPSIAKLMLNPSLGDIEKNKVKEELFVELANNVIQILLPEQRVQLPNGEVKSVDGLVYLCSEIEIPPEFKQLAQEAIEISKEILTP